MVHQARHQCGADQTGHVAHAQDPHRLVLVRLHGPPREPELRREGVRQRHPDGAVPRPPHWTGFRLAPERIEFWLNREYRLHERRLFVRSGEGWTSTLLYP